MRDFLANDYLARARDGQGLMYMKGGDKYYRTLIEQTTTEPLDPAQVHQLGLDEVARINKQFEEVRQQVGFKGSLHQFFDYMRTSPRFQPKSKGELEQGFAAVKRKVEAKVPQFFSKTPKSGLVIRPYPPFREKFEAGGSYEQGTPDGSRPGTFYFNAYDLPSRFTWEETTLFMHEGEPGHHFQISLAQENEALPAFMRFGGNTAYVEGWALYAESLGYPMEMYADPYQRFGNLNDEMLRAMRLVVDTGIHSKGWTREQSIKYMLDNQRRIEDRRDGRGRALHRHPEPGARLQDRPADDQPPARQGEGRRSVRSSTFANITRRCSTPARCRCRSSRRRSTTGSRRGSDAR